METIFTNRRKLPLIIEAEENTSFERFISSLEKKRNYFRQKLTRFGALLFRGFEVFEAADFEQFVRSFSNENPLDYTGGASPRLGLGGGVYTSTEYPAHLRLALHNELSYSENYPKNLYFCCLTEPETGGETPIADSRRILKKIDREIVDLFKKKKIKYIRNLDGEVGSGFSWQDAFETTDKRRVESFCRRQGISFEWSNDKLRLSQIRPATVTHPETGEEVWFNQAEGFHPKSLDAETYNSLISLMPEEEFRLNVRFGDGTPIDFSMIERIGEIIEGETIIFPWRKGDVLVLDNLLTAHGRMPFSGRRKIVVAMT